ncbi:hypothetical protein ES703_16763 [subsurface metagenome]
MADKEPEKYKRKIMRVGGSVVVAIPKEIRRIIELGIGERVDIFVNADKQIIIQKEEKAWDGIIHRKD